VASYQGQPNWGSVYGAGIQFSYAKATQAADYVNPDYTYDMTNGTAAGVVMGAYCFADFSVTAAAAANYFDSNAAPYVGAGYLRPVLDVEQSTSMTAAQVTSWVNTWCSTVQSATGVTPVIYCSPSYASAHFVSTDSTLAQWGLWLADWNGQNPQTYTPAAPLPWSSWQVWQYTDAASVNGISGAVDGDVAAGDMTTYVIPSLVGGSSQFKTGQVVHVNTPNGAAAYSSYTGSGSYVAEPVDTNAIIEGGPVYTRGALRWSVEYAGSSSITWTVGSLLTAGGAAKVTTFTASPNPVASGATVTLSATVSDPDSAVSKVAFYRESNGTSGLQTGSGGDALVGTASSSSSGIWSVMVSTAGLSGNVTFYAVATDTSGFVGPVASTNVQVGNGQFANPGFETPSVGSGPSGYAYAPSGASWTFAGYSGISGNGSTFTAGNPNAPEGVQVAFLEYSNSSIAQTVSMSGGNYQISFYAAQRQNVQASQQDFEVLVDGSVVGQFTPTSTNYAFYSTGPFTVATAGNHTVEFLGLDTAGGGNTAFIDDLNLYTAVPLPSYITASAGAAYSYNSSTGALSLSSGTLTFTADNTAAPLANLTASGSSSSVIFNTSEHLAGLTLSNGAQAAVLSLGSARTHANHNVLVLGTLGSANDPTFSVDSSSKLDLADNDLIVHTGSSDANGSSAYAAVAAMAQLGRNPASGAAGQPDGRWNGNGLDSSAANAADGAVGYEKIGLAVAVNGTLLSGAYSSWQVGSLNEALGKNDIIVKYDYLCDYVLGGQVWQSDAGVIQLEYDAGAASNHTWATGSSLWDGKCDGNEAGLIQLQYGLGTGGTYGAQL
jgi:GH25 family lysozyme M1 (1,4-beta-N-acetylmuramidase)